jgi:hypothetical protein
VDVVEVAAVLGHSKPTVTLNTYAHTFDRRKSSANAIEKLEAFRRGGRMVVDDTRNDRGRSEPVDLMVARGGIEPPTRGFSIRCSTN